MNKTDRIHLRASQEDIEALNKASEKLRDSTGKKPDTSKTIRTAVKMAADSKPDLFFINRPAIREVDSNIEYGRQTLQALYTLVTEFVPVESVSEMQGWYSDSRSTFMLFSEEAFREFATNKLLAIRRAKYPDLVFGHDNILIPDLTEIVEVATSLISIPEVSYKEVGAYWQCYTIEKNKIVVITEEVEKIKNLFRAYAVTPEEIRRLTLARELCESLNKFITEVTNPEKLNPTGVAYYDPESNRFEPSEMFVKFAI